MATSAIQKIDPGPDAPEDIKKAAENANKALLELPERTVKADIGFSRARFWFLAGLASVTVGGTLALVISAGTREEWVAAASAAAVVASLALAGLINPLQTIERDIIIRRWSDVIVSGWGGDLATTGSPQTATKRATEQFAVLAAAYATITSKTLDTLAAMNVPKGDTKDEGEEESAEVSITPIPAQSSARGETLKSALAVEAKGGTGTYKFTVEGLPTGLKIAESSGHITGTVDANAEAREWIVKVTATEVLEDKKASDGTKAHSGSTKFVWTVTAPANS